MNNIYVSELPKCCLVCKLGCPEEQRCVDGFTMDCDYCSVNERPSTCPLKPLTDRLAEERKKVVQELKDWCDKNFNWVGDGTGFDGQDYNEMIGSNNTINKLREKLDQIEGASDDNK